MRLNLINRNIQPDMIDDRNWVFENESCVMQLRIIHDQVLREYISRHLLRRDEKEIKR